MTETPSTKITQAARDAAAAYIRERFGDDYFAGEMQTGNADRALTVQHFARAIEEAAKVEREKLEECADILGKLLGADPGPKYIATNPRR